MLPMSWVTNRSLTPSPFRVVVTGIWGHGAQGKLPSSRSPFMTKGRFTWLVVASP